MSLQGEEGARRRSHSAHDSRRFGQDDPRSLKVGEPCGQGGSGESLGQCLVELQAGEGTLVDVR
jgi:hypothetical protein